MGLFGKEEAQTLGHAIRQLSLFSRRTLPRSRVTRYGIKKKSIKSLEEALFMKCDILREEKQGIA